jgi:hypothetical protein
MGRHRGASEPDRVAPRSPAIGGDHRHPAIGATEGGQIERGFADQSAFLVVHARRVKPAVTRTTEQ